MGWVADLSFVHDDLSAAQVLMAGASAVIGYVSSNPAKNLTKANVSDYLGSGLNVGLVYEDTESDMIGGRPAGQIHGLSATNQGKRIGYDVDSCVIFAANDRNAGPNDLETVLAYMDGFAFYVPRPGYYGDQDSIDWLAARRPRWYYWQSSSLAYGVGRSRNAHLLQRYNDPRARGLPLDVNDVQIPGIPFMEAQDMFVDADRAVLLDIQSQLKAPSGLMARIGAALNAQSGNITAHVHADEAGTHDRVVKILAAVEAEDADDIATAVVAKITSDNTPDDWTAKEIATAVLDELARRVTAGPSIPSEQ